MDAFPAFFSLTGRKVVVAGDGDGADAKARLFASSPAELVRLSREDALRPGVFEGALFAFVAGDEDFCREAAALARAAGALVNVVDRPTMSDFTTPAVVDRGEVVVAVGTAGAAPMMAALLRNDIEARIPEGAGRIAAFFRSMQDEIRQAFPDLTERRAFLRAAFASEAAEAAAAGHKAKAERLLRDALNAPLGEGRGRVRIVPGDGPADLLTLKAVRALAEADVLIADAATTPGILTLARRDARRLPAAESSAAVIAALSREQTVVRIIAGPLAQEAEALRQAGAVVETMPAAQP